MKADSFAGSAFFKSVYNYLLLFWRKCYIIYSLKTENLIKFKCQNALEEGKYDAICG